MGFESLFHDYWWLIFPLFGMVMAVLGMSSSERQTRTLMDLMKSYADQGKEPPPELMRAMAKKLEETADEAAWGPSNGSEKGWGAITFAALAAGFGVAYAFNRDEDWSWVFLAVTVAMGVMAFGAFAILITRRKP